MLPHKRFYTGYHWQEGGARIGRDNGTSVVSSNVFEKGGKKEGRGGSGIGSRNTGWGTIIERRADEWMYLSRVTCSHDP